MRRIDTALTRAAQAITKAVGTMWCALVFAALALISLPGALASGSLVVIVGWVAQTFLQLVLLSILAVGQNLAQAKTEQTIRETHDAAMTELAELNDIAQALHIHATGSPHPRRRPHAGHRRKKAS